MKNQQQDLKIMNDENGWYVFENGEKHYLEDLKKSSNFNISDDEPVKEDELGYYIFRGDKKHYFEDLEKRSKWLTSEEVDEIIEQFSKISPEIANGNKQLESLFKLLEDNLSLNNKDTRLTSSVFTLNKNNNQYQLCIFTDGAYFGYAFLINGKFAHIDYARKELSSFINDGNKYVTENNLPLQKNSIQHKTKFRT